MWPGSKALITAAMLAGCLPGEVTGSGLGPPVPVGQALGIFLTQECAPECTHMCTKQGSHGLHNKTEQKHNQ